MVDQGRMGEEEARGTMMLTKRELKSLSRDAYEIQRRLRKTIQTEHVIAATVLADSILDRLDDALDELNEGSAVNAEKAMATIAMVDEEGPRSARIR
jgi:hypothetical protein